jgi:hypothetical protein
MSGLILFGLIAFLIIDAVLLVLVLRWNDGETRSSQSSAPVAQPAKASAPDTTLAEEPKAPSSARTSFSTSAETTRSEDPAYDEPPGTINQETTPAYQRSLSSIDPAVTLSNYNLDDDHMARERSYLRQKATILETRIAALNESSETMTDYQRGMKAILEEELHAVWTRLGELESQTSRLRLARV